MQYPTLLEYMKAIQDAGNNLDKLAHLTPVLDYHGEPYRSSGAFAVRANLDFIIMLIFGNQKLTTTVRAYK